MLGTLGLQIYKKSALPSPISPTSIEEPCKHYTWMWILQAIFVWRVLTWVIRWRLWGLWFQGYTAGFWRHPLAVPSWSKLQDLLRRKYVQDSNKPIRSWKFPLDSWIIHWHTTLVTCKYLQRNSTAFKFWDVCRNLYFVPTHSQSWLISLPTTR